MQINLEKIRHLFKVSLGINSLIRALVVPTKLERKKHSRFKGELEDDAPCGMDSTYQTHSFLDLEIPHIPVHIQLIEMTYYVL